jgi:hypothetical protein
MRPYILMRVLMLVLALARRDLDRPEPVLVCVITVAGRKRQRAV